MIEETRIQPLNSIGIKKGDYVLYWMQQSQRVFWNHALEYAIRQANELGLPLVVFFGLTGNFPEANLRHYTFMLQGLAEVQTSLWKSGIAMTVRKISPETGALELSRGASLLVTDRGYLALQRQWRDRVAQNALCRVVQVESDVIVPIEKASNREQYSAGTLRPRLHRLIDHYLCGFTHGKVKKDSLGLKLDSLDLGDTGSVLALLDIDPTVAPIEWLRGGTSTAVRRLKDFIEKKLDRFHEIRNEPSLDYASHMSPYLHFGQISPLQIAMEVLKTGSPGSESFLEELIVRRELSMNFVYYNPHYTSYGCLPEWARKTLMEHKLDRREYLYSLELLERAQTHDPYWNAAQRELVLRGKMQGYMRMYWGKKILEWSRLPEEAYDTALYLNNRYSLDGRDANGYAGVAWCFGKHDRAWSERKVYGKVRYMNDRGLERKFDMKSYLKRVESYGTVPVGSG